MTTIAQAFDQLLRTLELTQGERAKAKTQQTTLRADLRKHLPRIQRDILAGSYSRGTAIRPLHDVDLFVILDEASHGSLRQSPPTACLQKVQTALAAAYPSNQPRLQYRSVNLTFSGTGIGYDVVPAFENAPDVYLIPDRERQSWIKTNPEKHRQALSAANTRAGSKLNPLIKAAKHWNAQKGRPLGSFHLEVMAYSAFSSPPPSYPAGLLALFAHLAASVLKNCPDPAGLSPHIDNGMPNEERLRIRATLLKAAGQAQQALQLDSNGHTEKAHRLWRLLLGNEYPEAGQP